MKINISENVSYYVEINRTLNLKLNVKLLKKLVQNVIKIISFIDIGVTIFNIYIIKLFIWDQAFVQA